MKKSFLLLTLAAAALLALSGCAALEGQDLSNDPISDEGITSIANSRLNDDSMTGRATLNATVESGLATLYGTVPDEATRQRAIQILKGTDGIFDVLDRTHKR
jgi:osmotically-inducible protein OsmY